MSPTENMAPGKAFSSRLTLDRRDVADGVDAERGRAPMTNGPAESTLASGVGQPRRMVIAGEADLASAIITESIPPERRDDYLRWVRGISRAAESFQGYRETNVFPPLQADGREWITIIHFQTRADLESWLGSDVRAEWVERFRREFGDFALHQVQGGSPPGSASSACPGGR